ncbi:coiled-coil domain-containing protein 173 [Nilaparvata lugens]|uniref:coiled-coil domain-containing protein 173 n=1 Tax=Nilaparvata lugens TaxID=108931 RepID=UPI00193D31C2|nr:coiled-coil domain-containing protein 173 [Nilaparvata lugens]
MRNIYVVQKRPLQDSRNKQKVRALVMTNQEWSSLLNKQMSDSQKNMDITERKRFEDESRKKLSKEMANTWDNTVINLRRRRLELRRERAAKLEADRRQRYLQTRKEEADENKKITEEAKERIRKGQDNYRNMISSVRFSEVLKEREEQVKFNKTLKEIEDQKEFEYVQTVRKDVKEYQDEQCKQKMCLEEEKRRLFSEFQQQLEHFFEKRNETIQKKIEQEREDNIHIHRETLQEEENARIEAEKKRQHIMNDVIENRRMIEEQAKIKRLEEEEEDNAIRIHAATKKRIARMRKEKEVELHEKAQERRNKITAQLHSEAAEIEAKENKILLRAMADRDAREEALLAKKKEYKEVLLQEVKEAHQNHMKLKEEKLRREEEESKWNMIQRFKQQEEFEKFNKDTQLERVRKMQLNKCTWDIQCAENIAAAIERNQDVKAVERAAEWWKDEDKHFLEYAQQLLKESRERGRPLLPILRVIEAYKKDNNLCKLPPQHKTWKSKVPIDSTSVNVETQTENKKAK